MNLQRQIVDSISQCVLNVFSTMLGVELAHGEASIEHGTPDANDGVVSFVGVAGAWAGAGSVTCSPALACRICDQMLMTGVSALNEEVLDAVAELTNIIVGNVKTDLERYTGTLGLSIPTVVFGKNLRTKSSGATEWVVVRFPWKGESLLVKMCLAPHQKTIEKVCTLSTGHACALGTPYQKLQNPIQPALTSAQERLKVNRGGE
jgi:chemotaxis protein CheX